MKIRGTAIGNNTNNETRKIMESSACILGIDIGSVTISAAVVAPDKTVLDTAYRFHYGDIATHLEAVLTGFSGKRISAVSATTSTPGYIHADFRCDNRIALIEGAKHHHPGIGSILVVGGEKFGLIRFDENGNYSSYKSNTSCAAGTGAFLDQQAARLNLGGTEELSRIAYANKGQLPKIASRCAVFAKTDLIHAQQEGYRIEEISDGLCYGLAKNIVDTLLTGPAPVGPMLFCGGVSKNRAVAGHIRRLTGMDLITDENAPVYEAIGTALRLIHTQTAASMLEIRQNGENNGGGLSFKHLFTPPQAAAEKYTYPPLALRHSRYPDFTDHESYEYLPRLRNGDFRVDVDLYSLPENAGTCPIHLGIDIGSTSTKAVLLETRGQVLAGFYTRTAGRPVEAVCALFEAVDDLARKRKIRFEVIGAGTTGSGRKFVGRLINADTVIDEITAHARAACELNPDVDTIIEIGGQDAKFTTLCNGTVSFSIMNTVCAAGTGSFIEEQARKLGCSIHEYSARTENVRAPMSSDRCTVFMERDINHYLSEGYTTAEVLASVLHSVRENYLQKVAVERNIGKTILFQGATAKNKALVAAFEQRLEKPILVSRYCHLTGALGTALMLADMGNERSTFRGFDIYKQQIPIRSEVCELCTNHCKLTLAHLSGETVAYGFLCGRDYDVKKRMENNPSGFDLIRSRKSAFRVTREDRSNDSLAGSGNITIGIPAGLFLVEALPFWRRFFHQLGFRTLSSERFDQALQQGRQLTGAEFCAPITAMHGHVHHLLEKADHVFLPAYLEMRQKTKGLRRQFCYYSQFMPALADIVAEKDRNRLLTPVLHYLYTSFHARMQLFQSLRTIAPTLSFFDMSAAYERARAFVRRSEDRLKEIYRKETEASSDIGVVLLGRPYSILSPSMNKGIPSLFGSLGIKAFFQDMIPCEDQSVSSIAPLLKEIRWHYGAKILEAAEVIAKTDGLYPVLVTSFKCAPDSFVKDYFQKIMAGHDKPYLILELDEHGSTVGYETRIEAAIRSFRNHDSSNRKPARKPAPADYRGINPDPARSLLGKTVVLPNWDSLTCRLLTANLQREGLNAVLMDETEESIRKSLRLNTGQCIPLNAITQGFAECIRRHDLNPAETVLWMTTSNTCSLSMYPHHIKTLLNAMGGGLEQTRVFAGELSFREVSIRAAVNAYFAYMFGGMVRKMGCKVRPYEMERGRTDQVIRQGMDILTAAFRGNMSKMEALERVVTEFERIEIRRVKKPLVAVFGDLYVRDNDVMNQGLIRFIEENGGEVITTPYLSYAKMVAGPYFRKWLREGLYVSLLSYKALLSTLSLREKVYYRYFERILKEPAFDYDTPPESILSAYNIKIENTGESLDNILKVFYIQKHYPDVALFVQASPSFCCASLITEAMAGAIERNTGVPVVSITYDGTGGRKNEAIIPYLTYRRRSSAGKTPETGPYGDLPAHLLRSS
ncbi:MAG: acyl-CoA dehydratase activase [Thermodesulfobacteriota bacterium]